MDNKFITRGYENIDNKDTKPHINNPELKKKFEGLLEQSEMHEHQLDLNLINTRLWIDKLNKKYNRTITIDTIPDSEWEELFKIYDMFWFMGIYTPSEASRENAKKYTSEYKDALPDIDKDTDVVASPFAIPEYKPNPQIANSWEDWDKVKNKLNEKGKKIILDFVPNHTALDHPWTKEHPEYYINGTKEIYEWNRDSFYKVTANDGNDYFLAHGKDPNFPSWSDTLQLNYAREDVQQEMKSVLLDLVDHANGVRCDMAMLLNAGTFIKTWGELLSYEEKNYIIQNNFWEKTIPIIKEKAQQKESSDFIFMAEAYWDKEELGQNFDYIYRKDFYDHLKKVRNGEAKPESLTKHIQYLIERANNEKHYKDVLFIENHDEERARKEFGTEASEAAAVLAGLIPDSIFLVNQGQPEGSRIRPPMQIGRLPVENETKETRSMKTQYEKLLLIKHTNLFENGKWSTIEANTLPSDMHIIKVEAAQDKSKSSIEDYSLGAVVMVNFSPDEKAGIIPQINSNHTVEVQSLSKGLIANPDNNRQNGMYIKLKPWETQIIFYSSIK